MKITWDPTSVTIKLDITDKDSIFTFSEMLARGHQAAENSLSADLGDAPKGIFNWAPKLATLLRELDGGEEKHGDSGFTDIYMV